MTEHVTPEQFQRLLSAELNAAEQEAIQNHVEKCEVCEKELERLLERTEGKAAGADWQQYLRPESPPASDLDFLRRLRDQPPSPPPTKPDSEDDGDDSAIQFPEPPTNLGPLGRLESYHIIEKLGKGGYGFVYKSYDEKLDCLVALKVLKPHLAAIPAERAAFEEEARKAGRVKDDHIVTIHHVGSNPSFPLPYFVMEYIDGGTLADRLHREGPLPAGEAARIVMQAAQGLAAAHARGLVHRDMKPSNILLERGTGRVKVTDFGLAKRLKPSGPHTQPGVLKGTIPYMAPEQASGRNHAITPATDVHAVGTVLYEALTGRSPFLAAGVADTLHRITSEEPLPPTRLQPKTPRDLETICLKCLRKEPHKRYESAEALAEDLRRYLAGEPILARPARKVERMLKWAKRRPLTAALLGLSSLAAMILMVAGLWFVFKLEIAAERTIFERAILARALSVMFIQNLHDEISHRSDDSNKREQQRALRKTLDEFSRDRLGTYTYEVQLIKPNDPNPNNRPANDFERKLLREFQDDEKFQEMYSFFVEQRMAYYTAVRVSPSCMVSGCHPLVTDRKIYGELKNNDILGVVRVTTPRPRTVGFFSWP